MGRSLLNSDRDEWLIRRIPTGWGMKQKNRPSKPEDAMNDEATARGGDPIGSIRTGPGKEPLSVLAIRENGKAPSSGQGLCY